MSSQDPEPPLSPEVIFAILMSVSVVGLIVVSCCLWSTCNPESFRTHITDRLPWRKPKQQQTYRDNFRAIDFQPVHVLSSV